MGENNKERKSVMLSNERCKHGMIKGQCGVCKKWTANSWSKKEETDMDRSEITDIRNQRRPQTACTMEVIR